MYLFSKFLKNNYWADKFIDAFQFGIIHLVRTQIFSKNQHFVPSDISIYV